VTPDETRTARPLTSEQVDAIVRAIQTVAFIEPCPKCASRERLALARLLFADLTKDEIRELVALEMGAARIAGDAEVASWR
jgi:hypothetical protein